MIRHLLILILATLACASSAAAADHPRLLFSAADIPALRAKITSEPILGMYQHLLANWDAGDWGIGSATPATPYDECSNMVNAGFLYVLTGDDLWAQRARTLVENRIGSADWANSGLKGLALDMHGKAVALAYDFCYGAPSWVGFEATVSQKLLAQGNTIYVNGGTEQNGNAASNWQANRYSAAGLCLLATDEVVPAGQLDGCFAKVNLYSTSNMGTGAANRGWNIEGVGYNMYPFGNFIGPYGIAAKRVTGQNIRAASPSAIDYTLWTIATSGCRFEGSAPGQVQLLKPDWGDDNLGFGTEGTSGLAFYYCPAALAPGLVHWYDRTVGANGNGAYDNARSGTIYSILYHPGSAVPAQDPMAIPQWVAGFIDIDGNGYQTFRNQYQSSDDMLAQVYVKRRGNAGHSGPDALGFRIIGLDSLWAVGGGRYGPKINGQEAYWRSQNSLYPVDPESQLTTNGNSGALIGLPTSSAVGGAVVATMGTNNVNVRNHTRRFLADYSPASGATAVYVVADTSDDGRWWQFCTAAANSIVTAGNTFTVTSPTGATLQGTVISPATTTLTTGTRIRGSGFNYRGIDYSSNNYVHAQSADGDFLVVMSVVPAGGTHPAVTSLAGVAATSGRVLQIGGLQVAINGDRVALEVPTANTAPAVSVPAAASANQVLGATVGLSATGSDDGGEPALSYTWQAVGASPAPVSFSPNGTNAAKAATATFTQAGVYDLEVRIADDHGLAVTSQVTVTVTRTQTRIAVSPPSASVARAASTTFVATAVDQFGVAMGPQPICTWSVSGGGSIAANGVFTAGSTLGGPYTVSASSAGLITGTASVSVVNLAPTVATAAACVTAQPVVGKTATLTVLGADDLGEPALKYSWSTVGTPPAAVSFSASGTNAAKTCTATFVAEGAYVLRATIVDVSNASVVSDVTVTVVRTQTKVAVSPATLNLARSGSVALSGAVVDQFAVALGPQPTLAWSSATGGSVQASSGVFTAGTALGPVVVTASGGGFTGTATITVINTAPTVATAAACPNAQPITTKTAVFTALGADDLAESFLTYSWSTTGTPPAAVSFSPNGTNAAKSTTATFAASGTYTLRATIKDGSNATVVSDVTVSVVRTQTRIAVTPATLNLARSASVTLTGSVVDQFSVVLDPQTTIAWSSATGGSVNAASGLFTAGTTLGPVVVTASGGGFTGTATITVVNTAPTVATPAACATAQPIVGKTASVSVLGGDDLGEAGLIYTWSTVGTPPAAVGFSPNGTNAAKSSIATFAKIGTYTLRATIKDASNATITSDVAVSVQATFTGIIVSPAGSSLAVGASAPFAAVANDQFAALLVSQPSFAWTVNGGGAIDATGILTAGATTGGPYLVTATASAIAGSAAVTVTAAGLPTGWSDRDIGGPTTTGNASFASATGVWTVKGAGSDIGGSSDQFHFASQSLTGNGQIVVRVMAQQNTDPNAKTGVMIRDGFAANAAQAVLALTPAAGAQFIRRTTAGSNCSVTSVTGKAAPYWVKLVRSSTTFSAWISVDGVTWTQVGSNQTMTMGTTVAIGLVVSSKVQATLGTVTFDNVTVTPTGGG